ncbi:hypothetical protein A6V36_01675 [Paraburkholderia ginsengiterrae]|uniref:Uncharacterized protein n=1 Tax=Paraburkholderia ginsengiterrae TaxID=1462993 RepID=A0A1A9NBX8_9BURK|nr:hypothetical protein [Paraburkholderia ginsengiterrae]OAJ60532.1 hypothetical protein A6V36_01675 [Paraburkholderia ginsengiterrae]OAJ64083.1 hypothetical protein A6V37_00865 [Paraburkholderia ginsengiterrae]
MSSSTLKHVTYAIADAMLAGPAEPDAMVERMTHVLGGPADWMNGLARQVAKRFAARWDTPLGLHALQEVDVAFLFRVAVYTVLERVLYATSAVRPPGDSL